MKTRILKNFNQEAQRVRYFNVFGIFHSIDLFLFGDPLRNHRLLLLPVHTVVDI